MIIQILQTIVMLCQVSTGQSALAVDQQQLKCHKYYVMCMTGRKLSNFAWCIKDRSSN